jgi:Rha family phage regulatory protein
MSALVELTQFGARTNSRIVAEVFEKEHKHVLAAIDDILEKKPALRGPNFRPTEEVVKIGVAPRTIRFFDMDRDGFTLVAMGFTGAKALDWKIAFIEAFNRMEAALRSEADADRDAEPLVMRDYSPALAVIREARQIFPPKAVRDLWPRLGLPDPFRRAAIGSGEDGLALIDDSISAWRDACTVDEDGTTTRANELWTSYCNWCETTGRAGVNQTRFGRALTNMGYRPARASDSGYVHRHGLKLIG